ncbi:unnamed protein product [Mytilus edulis]|uniref:Uncharacterized protein n=1 Tax=Mytilus edulis TaxID=6550 RepID=A0A8S3TI79_MYTED|nr:unnamed protein product [Mytilus edulis]
MAEGHDAEKLRDIIESLRGGKQKKLDSNESDDDFQESFEELDQENGGTANPKLDTAHVNSEMETSELEKQLKELQVESKKAHLRQQIAKEKESLRTIHRSALTLPEGLQPSSLQQHSATGEPINFSQPNKEQSALQILSFIWPEPVEQFQTFTLGGEVEFRVAARNVWYSVLLYDKEYRQKQADELFEWGIYRQDLRDFQLVSKRDNPTFRAFSEASVGASKVIEDTMFNCNRGLHLLIRTLRELGYNINWSKVEGPAQRITFLGIIIDTRELTLTMPPEKQSDFYNLLLSFQKRKRASIKQIQSLCGKLNWACQMVKGGRTFLRRLINSISSAQNRNDKVLLNSEFEADISWWLNFMSVFNGTVKFIDFKPITSLQTDASSLGGGGYYNGDYFYVNWAIDFPVFRKEHINIKETLAVVLSVLRWGHLWQNKTVIVLTDNMTTKCILNKGSTKNNVLMSLLRDLFWLSARYNFDIKGKFLSGRCNIIADAASRLHEEGQLSRLYDILTSYSYISFSADELLRHVSYEFYICRWCKPAIRLGDNCRTLENQGVG